MDKLHNQINLAAQAIKNADALFITAGAGMSIDSGLPDFKHISGFSASFDLLKKNSLVEFETAQSDLFEQNPEKAWAFYGYQLNLYKSAIPHEGYQKLLELGNKKQYGYFIFTSNVDGLFQKAGFNDAFIEECNGSMHYFQCVKPCSSHIWKAPKNKIIIDREHFKATGPLPQCPYCGEIARPNILMPNDWTWLSQRTIEQGNRLQLWLETIDSLDATLAIIELGANHNNPTVRLQSQRVNRSIKSTLIRINTNEHQIKNNGIGIALGPKEALVKIGEAYKSLPNL